MNKKFKHHFCAHPDFYKGTVRRCLKFKAPPPLANKLHMLFKQITPQISAPLP